MPAIIFHKKQLLVQFSILLGLIILFSACGQSTPNSELNEANSTETDEPTKTSVPTETSAPKKTLTPTETPQPTKIFVPTETVVPTQTPDPTATLAPTSTTIPMQLEQEGASMVRVLGGNFPMGYDAERLREECYQFRYSCVESLFAPSAPQHTVQLPDFYIDTYEVTNEAFTSFLNDLGDHEATCNDEDCWVSSYSQITQNEGNDYQVEANKEDYPVTGVTWYGAKAFCEWRGARLPLEAEWEMAASWDAETETKTLYPWGDNFYGDITNFCDKSCAEQHAIRVVDDGHQETSPVGSFEVGRSPAGAYDMGGNVWEWTADWFAADYYENSPTTRPVGPDEGSKRVVRGGSWFDTGNFTSTVIRFPAVPTETGDTIGFRCALDNDG